VSLGEVFSDAEVARLYACRPPYPLAVFDLLRRLVVAPFTVLDAGAGTGALARGMVSFAGRVDAVEPADAMVAAGRQLEAQHDQARIRWIIGRAEDAKLEGPYGLITCGASLHWMDLDVVLRRFRDALAPRAVVAIADTESVHGDYRNEILEVIREHSEVRNHKELRDLVESLRDSGRFAVKGQIRTDPLPFEQSVEEYIGMLHSTSTLARVRLGAKSEAFDTKIRAVFRRRGIDRVRYGVVGLVAWGMPS
jgi:SAM-dependent methyltransferase